MERDGPLARAARPGGDVRRARARRAATGRRVPTRAEAVERRARTARRLGRGRLDDRDDLARGLRAIASERARGTGATSSRSARWGTARRSRSASRSALPARRSYCLDGDGAVLMHMGSLAVIGTRGPRNLKHVVINNGAHDSVGGQPTAARDIDLSAVALACGYAAAETVEGSQGCGEAVARLRAADGPAMLEVRVASRARTDAGRPTSHSDREQGRVHGGAPRMTAQRLEAAQPDARRLRARCRPGARPRRRRSRAARPARRERSSVASPAGSRR